MRTGMLHNVASLFLFRAIYFDHLEQSFSPFHLPKLFDVIKWNKILKNIK